MRKILLSFCIMLCCLISVPVYAYEVEKLEGVAVVEAERLNVRSGPSKDYEKLGILLQDVSVEVNGIVEPGWYAIDFEGQEGYISSEYVIFTPLEEIEIDNSAISKRYMVMALVVAILILSGILIYTFINIRKEEETEEEEVIPITDHDDTNMHMGEITYDTYRIDIDPKYFEQTTSIPQPDFLYEDRRDVLWKKDLYEIEDKEEKNVKEQLTSEAEIQALDTKLEQASAQIAALQKEVEQLKKQQTGSI